MVNRQAAGGAPRYPALPPRGITKCVLRGVLRSSDYKLPTKGFRFFPYNWAAFYAILYEFCVAYQLNIIQWLPHKLIIWRTLYPHTLSKKSLASYTYVRNNTVVQQGDNTKKRKLIKKLKAKGARQLRQGGNHEFRESRNGYRFPIPRHTEIDEQLAMEILKQADK